MTAFFAIKNFDRFQHYRDRNPPWIKLHVVLLDDYAFGRLPDAAKAHLLGIWILASKSDNRLPHDADWIARRISANSKVDLAALFDAGFLVPAEEADQPEEPWASRYIPAEVRAEVLASTGGKCAKCGTELDIEIDHIVPISKGGTSERSNLQPLCRKCNRAKRVATAAYGAEQVAPQMRSPESEAEERKRAEAEEKKQRDAAVAAAFEVLWSAYPKRPGNSKADALKAYRARLNDGADPESILNGVRGYAKFVERSGTEPKYVKQAKTFLGPGRHWESDYTYVAPPSPLDPVYAALAAEANDVGRMRA